jgi:hypothetical protein
MALSLELLASIYKEVMDHKISLQTLSCIDKRELFSFQGKDLNYPNYYTLFETKHKQTNRANKGNCCFNHIIGLPRKDGIEKPLFDYELLLYRALLEPGFFSNIAFPSLR